MQIFNLLAFESNMWYIENTVIRRYCKLYTLQEIYDTKI